eukprot:s94_g89.t1
MERLVGQNKRAKKVEDQDKNIVLDPLSEDEKEDMQREESGSPPRDRMADTLSKLTEDKKRVKMPARLALRNALQKNPEEIHQTIERLMYEDLSRQTLGPGLNPVGLNAKARVGFRSKISNYKTGAFCAWSLAGILDALILGQPSAARARACLALLQLDQTSIDRGSWSLASELSLEMGPPMGALASHQLPNVQDGESPFSRLLCPRWAEICLGQLKEQEERLSKRRALGKNITKGNKEENDDTVSTECRKRTKAKAKAKAAASTEKAGET